MDLVLFARVVWGRKLIVIAALLVGTSLAFLSYVSLDLHGSNHLRYRDTEQWASYSTLFVTQNGFPWGSIGTNPGAPTKGSTPATHAVDPTRFISLAVIYAQLIPSDGVLAIMRRHGPIDGSIEAAAVTDPNNTADTLPLISIAGISTSRGRAERLVGQATSAFQTYLTKLQAANGIPAADRVVLQVVDKPGRTKLLVARSKTLPIVVFLTVSLAAIAICFILENLHPRMRVVQGEGLNDRLPDAPSRTA